LPILPAAYQRLNWRKTVLHIGSYNTLVVQRKVDFGLYLNPKEEEVLLPSKYVPPNTRVGDSLRVFVYTDSEDRPVATTRKPKAVAGEVAFLAVKDTTAIGSFMDWGLEKDLLVPKAEQETAMGVGRRYVVKVLLDRKTKRVFGSARIARHCRKACRDFKAGQQVRLMIYRFTRLGTLAVVDDDFIGLIYHSETFEPLKVGERRPGYIRALRADGRIDLTLKKPGSASLSDSSRRILEVLRKYDGFLPLHDKSRPEDITALLAMSKKEFKRASGGLYKKRLIDITDQGLYLKAPPD
jgi:predicted RNA-binding protein (virulence factor B family)